MSRPEIPIDWDRVNSLLIAGCMGTEVAAFFAMHPNTFYDRVFQKFGVSFTEYLQEKRSSGEALLREAQYSKAIGATKEGDNTLLIWLGKQRLNQSDTPTEISVSPDTVKQFKGFMEQLTKVQQSLKSSDNSIKS